MLNRRIGTHVFIKAENDKRAFVLRVDAACQYVPVPAAPNSKTKRFSFRRTLQNRTFNSSNNPGSVSSPGLLCTNSTCVCICIYYKCTRVKKLRAPARLHFRIWQINDRGRVIHKTRINYYTATSVWNYYYYY